MTIKNYNEVVEKLTEMLMQFEKELNSAYDTDVYLYYDAEAETATLKTFQNVGGNSWLDDEHCTIYTDKQHYNSFLETLVSIYGWGVEDIAVALDMEKEELIKKTADYLEYDVECIDLPEIFKFVKENDEYRDGLFSWYENIVDDNRSDCEEQAREIIDRFLAEAE